MRVVFLFIDGFGLAPGSDHNPLATTPTPNLSKLFEGRQLTAEAVGYTGDLAALYALDATLGVPGRPQSATGQTALFTGVNAPKAVGRHINGFPDERLRNILAAEGMLKKIISAGFSATFANAYRPEFFALTDIEGYGFSASTFLTYYAGLSFRTFGDMESGTAVYFDITNSILPSLGHDVPPISPELAGERLANIAGAHDFVLFEHFLTDVVGHKCNAEKAVELVDVIDRFIGSIISRLDMRQTLLMLTSDHGNLEDLTSRAHTLNPVPLLLIGNYRNLRPIPYDLTGVLDLVLTALHSG